MILYNDGKSIVFSVSVWHSVTSVTERHNHYLQWLFLRRPSFSPLLQQRDLSHRQRQHRRRHLPQAAWSNEEPLPDRFRRSFIWRICPPPRMVSNKNNKWPLWKMFLLVWLDCRLLFWDWVVCIGWRAKENCNSKNSLNRSTLEWIYSTSKINFHHRD